MHAAGVTVRQCQSPARPLPGTHPDSEAFAAALARQKQAHACAAAEESTRCKQLQIRRENFCHARHLLGAILDGAFDKISASEIARFAVLQCADSAATQVESHHAESFARRCVWHDYYDSTRLRSLSTANSVTRAYCLLKAHGSCHCSTGGDMVCSNQAKK
jgi:hypothetical protein